jgi:hypothetical protein
MGLTADFKAEFDLDAILGQNGLQIPTDGRGGVVVTGETDLFALVAALAMGSGGLGLPLPWEGAGITVVRLVGPGMRSGVAATRLPGNNGKEIVSVGLPGTGTLPIGVDLAGEGSRINTTLNAVLGTPGVVRVFIRDPGGTKVTVRFILPQAS